MATRVEDILARVRDVLADPSKTRYTDTNLLRLLTSGVNDFLIRTKVSKSVLYIPIENYVALYKLQDYSQAILRVQYLDLSLEPKTIAEMDALDPNWVSTKGEVPLYVIFENLPQGSFKIYPKVASSTTSIVTVTNTYGGLIDIEMTDELVGFPDLDDLETFVSSYLTITYIRKQGDITTSTELYIDSMYDEALVYYVSGMALRADADTQNRAFGNEQITLYNGYVDKAFKNESTHNNTLSPRASAYKGFI